jgi:hypothetical protein
MAVGRHSRADAQPRIKRDLAVDGALIAKYGRAMNERVHIEEDFFGDVGQALGRPWVYTETGASTNPTGDFVSAVGDGVFRLLHSADSEAQTLRLDWGDTLMINMSKKPRIEIRAKLDFAGANFSADQRAVLGLASAYNATLDSVATNAWFRVEGANLNVLIESDDGTLDDDDNDSTIDLVDNTWTVFEIDCADLDNVAFRVDGVQVAQKLDMGALAANTWVQPIAAIQRDAGTEAEKLDIDYIKISWERT